MERIITNVLELKSESQTQKTLIHNYCKDIEDLATINDEDILYFSYLKDTKELVSLSKGHHNNIWIFIAYLRYQIHDNDPVGN